jgi:hypothetical protein
MTFFEEAAMAVPLFPVQMDSTTATNHDQGLNFRPAIPLKYDNLRVRHRSQQEVSMRFIFERKFHDGAILLLVFALVMPLLGGCSQLGIAKVDDLTATETRLQNQGRANTTRIETLEKADADMQKTLTELVAGVDTLNTRFMRAKAWLETMDLDTIADNANEASKLALSAEARSQDFFKNYLAWIREMQSLLQKQILLLEAKMEDSAAGATPAEDSPDNNEDTTSTGGGG